MNYYFLGASLPMLSLDAPPPFSFADFQTLCRRSLNQTDLAAVEELDLPIDQPAHHTTVAQWKTWETMLRNAVVRIRAARLKRDPIAECRPQTDISMEIEKAAADAMAQENPASRELALDRFRWKQADELAGHNPFSSEAIIAYALKLKLALRWAALSREKGAEVVSGALAARPSENRQRSVEV